MKERAEIITRGNRQAHIASMRFEGPKFISCDFGFYPATAFKYRDRIPDFYRRHPWIYDPGDMEIPANLRAGTEYVDEWGCRWRTLEDGLDGQVIEHPLADWSALDTFTPPKVSIDKVKIAAQYAEIRRKGWTWTKGGGNNFFERLRYLRGFENLLMDMAGDTPELVVLIDKLVKQKIETLEAYLEFSPDAMFFYDDLGIQDRLMMSPASFRKYLKPAYTQIFSVGVKHNIINWMHSDGIINQILGDLKECGLNSVNLQGDIIGIDYLAAEWKGKIHLSWNLDMQYKLPHAPPSQMDDYIGNIVKKIWLAEGGLSLAASIMPDMPWENIEALTNAMEKWCFYQG
ncbi:MAG: uroporphyrinogen decarboxylase family protein [Candidatus Ratteibacteria bacterium]